MINLQTTLMCNLEIDFSQVTGDKILPFKIALDLENSVLEPIPGQNQKFCYTVTGVGEDKPEFADLSHLVFGICNQITKDQIVNITVNIDGVDQTVVFGEGGNVELRIPSPDPPTGCLGLKFDFPLNKVNGVMKICYELTTPFPVGDNPVCLFGGNTTAKGLSICGPACGGSETCVKYAQQSATICVPVTVTPTATTGTVTTICCGDAVITPGTLECPGTVNKSCKFTISQRVCVLVPVVFGAHTDVGELFVECEDATGDGCTDCNDN